MDSLGFLWPNPDFSMGTTNPNKKISSRVTLWPGSHNRVLSPCPLREGRSILPPRKSILDISALRKELPDFLCGRLTRAAFGERRELFPLSARGPRVPRPLHPALARHHGNVIGALLQGQRRPGFMEFRINLRATVVRSPLRLTRNPVAPTIRVAVSCSNHERRRVLREARFRADHAMNSRAVGRPQTIHTCCRNEIAYGEDCSGSRQDARDVGQATGRSLR